MLEIRKTAVSFEEADLMELERILLDRDIKWALRFMKASLDKDVKPPIPGEGN
ncbi:hypothetical protein ACFLYE_00165 [Chloroflexota bacterium]